MKKLLFIAALTITIATATAQTTPTALKAIVVSQDLTANRIVAVLSDTTASTSSAARDARVLAEALGLLQAAESRAYTLVAERDSAPQVMTAAAVRKAIAEAKALGVSHSMISNLLVEWDTASDLAGAEQVLIKFSALSSDKAEKASQTGSFFRAMPRWMGGTTSYANYKAPKIGEPDEAARIAALEARLGLLGVVK